MLLCLFISWPINCLILKVLPCYHAAVFNDNFRFFTSLLSKWRSLSRFALFKFHFNCHTRLPPVHALPSFTIMVHAFNRMLQSDGLGTMLQQQKSFHSGPVAATGRLNPIKEAGWSDLWSVLICSRKQLLHSWSVGKKHDLMCVHCWRSCLLFFQRFWALRSKFGWEVFTWGYIVRWLFKCIHWYTVEWRPLVKNVTHWYCRLKPIESSRLAICLLL